jgi:hypothetical protein
MHLPTTIQRAFVLVAAAVLVGAQARLIEVFSGMPYAE